MEIVVVFLKSKTEPMVDDLVSDGTNVYLVQDIKDNVLYGANVATGKDWSGTGFKVESYLTILYTQKVKVLI